MTLADTVHLRPISARGGNGDVDAKPPRRRILLSASASSPYRGSEPGVGWNVGVQLARHCDVTMLVNPGAEERNKNDIEKFIATNGPVPNLDIRFVERPALCRKLQHGPPGRFLPLYYIGYAAWQRAAFEVAKKLHAEKPFDLIHHLTIIGFREPGYLWKLNAPFVWGPIGGAANLPWRYFELLGLRDQIFYGARNLANVMHKRFKRRPRLAARAAQHIWGATLDDVKLISEIWHRPAHQLAEVGCMPSPAATLRRFDGKDKLRLIWSGLHIGRKALPILLHAMAQMDNRIELIVLGAGPLTEKWQALAAELRIADRIRWLGHLPHEDALNQMSTGHLFVSSSVLESTSTVVIEALSMGLPVICHDACGMGTAVTERCGIKVPMIDPQRSIDGYAIALQRVLETPGIVESLSSGALQRCKELSWQGKAQTMVEAYERVLAGKEASRVRS